MAEKKTAAAVESPVVTEKKVRIKIPFSREASAPVFVGVNGEFYTIKRGVEVEVPWYVADVIENSEREKLKAFEYEQSVADKN